MKYTGDKLPGERGGRHGRGGSIGSGLNRRGSGGLSEVDGPARRHADTHGRQRGFFVAFGYTRDAEQECAAFHGRTGRIIKLLIVQEIRGARAENSCDTLEFSRETPSWLRRPAEHGGISKATESED